MITYTLAIILAVVSFLVTTLIYPRVLSFARRHKIVDNPNARKLQRVPVPVMGGTSVFIGVLAAAVVGFTVQLVMKHGDFSLLNWRMVKVIGLMGVMYAIGVWDDIKDVSATLRFMVEILVVWAMILLLGVEINDFHGLWGIHQIPDAVSVPLSLIAGVGLMNAVNMIDGVDGYCSSFGIMACTAYAILFAYAGDLQMFALTLIGIGALLPFFFHNVFGRTSKMFLGDGGSLMLGTVLTLFTFTALSSDSPCALILTGDGLSIVAFTLAVVAVPVFDTLRVMIMRVAHGRSPFHPDKTHLHHLYIELGHSHLATSGIIVTMNALIVVFLLVLWLLGVSINWQVYFVMAIAFAYTWGFYFFMEHEHRKNDGGGSHLWKYWCVRGQKSTSMSRTRGWLVIRSIVDSKFLGGTPPEEEPAGTKPRIDPRIQ